MHLIYHSVFEVLQIERPREMIYFLIFYTYNFLLILFDIFDDWI